MRQHNGAIIEDFMLKVKIIAVGKLKDSWLGEAIEEYEKRMRGKCKIEWELADSTKELIRLCDKENFFLALDIEGEMLNSIDFFKKWVEMSSRLVFCIGGPEGLPSEILKKASFRWSLSRLTFTNQMARLILVEQIYRALEIGKGTQYHK